MARYILRRMAQMIPTVFGVAAVTFLLFNVAGGSPGAMALGKHASPRAVEEFDEQRGYNKPLFFGNWTGTRALEDTDFNATPGPWRNMPGVSFADVGGGRVMELAPGGEYSFPMAFPLRPDTLCQIELNAAARGAGAEIVYTRAGSDTQDSEIIVGLPPSGRVGKISATFRTGDTPAAESLTILTRGARVTVKSLSLRRKTRHFFDSQFVFFLGRLVRLDFGVSSYSNQRVSDMLKAGILPSLALTVPIFFGGLIVAVVVALLCAFLRGGWVDRAIVVVSVALMSVNYLVWIVFGQYVLAFKAGWFPIWGFESWRYLLLPVIVGIVSGLGANVRFFRTVMLDEIYKDYVRTAYAKGLGHSAVLFKHVLRNAMIPILTNVVIAIPFLYTGSLLLESFFGIPGLGGLAVNAINSADVEVVRAVVFIGAVIYVFANLLTDITYTFADPRVRLK